MVWNCKKCHKEIRQKLSMICMECAFDPEFEEKKKQLDTVEECIDLIAEYREAKGRV